MNLTFMPAMTDFQNNGWFFVVAGVLVSIVLFQSVLFLINAYKQGVKIGMSKEKLNKAISSSAIFSIVPSLSIILVILVLADGLGFALPWARLSVVGALTYELPAATTAAGAIGGTGSSIAAVAATKIGFVTIAWVMTLGIIMGPIVSIFGVKPMEKGVAKLKARDNVWGKIMSDALFLGMISAFLGYALSGTTTDRQTSATIPATVGSILVAVLTIASSAGIMIVCVYFVKKRNVKWLENFALPFSMLGAMALAILYRTILPATLFI